jgi:uncharacterized iron-regulated protein
MLSSSGRGTRLVAPARPWIGGKRPPRRKHARRCLPARSPAKLKDMRTSGRLLRTFATFWRRGWLICLLSGFLPGCQAVPLPPDGRALAPSHPGFAATGEAETVARTARALRPADLAALDTIIPKLARRRVVFVGETHDRYADHLIQLEIVRRLHALRPNLAIGVEYFQQPFQRFLDAYVDGQLDEAAMLRDTEYFDRWRFDYRLYRPILRYAREHRIPVIALNLPAEVTDKVAQEGMAALSAEDRRYVPRELDRSDPEYVARLRAVFAHHPHRPGGDFERFLDVQLLWDEGMAARAARFLEKHPDTPMVVLAGSGHLAYGAGIPRRLVRRVDVTTAIVLNGLEAGTEPDIADFLVLSEDAQLPPAGRLGVALEARDNSVGILRTEPGSPAAAAGLRAGDVVLAIDGQPVHQVADVKIALLDKHPGDTVSVEVRRRHWFGDREVTYRVILGS